MLKNHSSQFLFSFLPFIFKYVIERNLSFHQEKFKPEMTKKTGSFQVFLKFRPPRKFFANYSAAPLPDFYCASHVIEIVEIVSAV